MFRHVPDGFRNDMPGWTMQQVRSKGGDIVLFHDIHPYTADAVPGIIAQMRAEGFTFTNLDDVRTFPLLNGETPPWVGDACGGDCPDRGNATTFCVSLDGGDSGSCVLQAKVSNANCDDFPGLFMETRDRHIGNSTASTGSAAVCVPRQE